MGPISRTHHPAVQASCYQACLVWLRQNLFGSARPRRFVISRNSRPVAVRETNPPPLRGPPVAALPLYLPSDRRDERDRRPHNAFASSRRATRGYLIDVPGYAAGRTILLFRIGLGQPLLLTTPFYRVMPITARCFGPGFEKLPEVVGRAWRRSNGGSKAVWGPGRRLRDGGVPVGRGPALSPTGVPPSRAGRVAPSRCATNALPMCVAGERSRDLIGCHVRLVGHRWWVTTPELSLTVCGGRFAIPSTRSDKAVYIGRLNLQTDPDPGVLSTLPGR